MQIELALDTPIIPEYFPVNKVNFGVPFKFKDQGADTFIRVKPVNFLLNSTILNDVINRGDVIVCRLAKGTIFVTQGTRPIQLLDATVVVKGVK